MISYKINRKIYILVTIISILFLAFGYFLGHYSSRPKRLPFDGESLMLRNRYEVQSWYYLDTGELKNIMVIDTNSNTLLLNDEFWPSGCSFSYLQRVPAGSIRTVYNKNNGKPARKFYFHDDDKFMGGEIYRTEYYSKDGKLLKIEEPNDMP